MQNVGLHSQQYSRFEKKNAHFEKKILIFEKRTDFFLTIFCSVFVMIQYLFALFFM